MQSRNPKLSVVILCYRAEEQAITFSEEIIKLTENLGISYELVLVANYHKKSKHFDRTPGLVRDFAKNNPRIPITVVAKEKEGMMGWDMISGLNAVKGEAIAVIDGDGQMPANDVIKVYKRLVETNSDIAKTYRVVRFDGAKRIIISKVYNFIAKLLFPKIKVYDINSKPKIFKREALEKLKLESGGWFIDAEIIIKASGLGMTIAETPTEFHSNKLRPSFIKTFSILEFFGNLILYRLKLWRNKL